MKRLYKSEDDKKLSGVCGGIGEYVNVDPTAIRVVYVIITLLTGVLPGIIAYIALEIIMPTKKEVS